MRKRGRAQCDWSSRRVEKGREKKMSNEGRIMRAKRKENRVSSRKEDERRRGSQAMRKE